MKYTLTLLLCLFTVCAGAQQKIKARATCTLTGTLKLKMFYGPPGFGEDPAHDAKEPSYILTLDRPVLFADDDLGDGSWEALKKVHVFSPGDTTIALKPFNGKRVTIRCQLAAAHTGHHHAPAITWELYSVQ